MKTINQYSNRTSKKKTETHIFLVEDDMMYRIALGYNLQKIMGYKVSFYSSGQECLKNLNRNPNIVVLDYYLAEGEDDKLNGLEILKQIQQQKPETPVIILSAQKEINVALNTLKEGAYTYITKDKHALEQLQKTINEIVTERNSRMNNNYL